MEIDRTSTGRPERLTPTTPTDPSTTSPVASEREAAQARQDRIDLSAEARDLGSEPDGAREAKLAALRAQIDAGTYRMDPNGVARRIVARQDI